MTFLELGYLWYSLIFNAAIGIGSVAFGLEALRRYLR